MPHILVAAYVLIRALLYSIIRFDIGSSMNRQGDESALASPDTKTSSANDKVTSYDLSTLFLGLAAVPFNFFYIRKVCNQIQRKIFVLNRS